MSKNDKYLKENQIESKKNTKEQLDYYAELEQFFNNDSSSALTKLRTFSAYVPRQVISDFLVRFELFKLVQDIPGSILEFGVYNGQGLMSWANYSAILEPNNLSRKIFGFDTFEGFSGVSGQDTGTTTSTVLEEGGYNIDSHERLTKSIALFDQNRFIGHVEKVQLIKGDVTKTLEPFLSDNPHLIASLVYLDMDIYQPTKYVLENILSRVPKGGVVAFDELNLKEFPGESIALLEALDINTIELKRVPFCSRISYFRM